MNNDWNNFSNKIINYEPPFFRERDVWWTAIGINVGHEENGKGSEYSRPVLILKKFGKSTFLGVPFTTKINRKVNSFDFIFNGKLNLALLTQMRVFDSRRLLKKIGKLNIELFQKIRKNAKDLL
jgi:mRNA-degrading endonuclease toxin of MazEF toxin-antitoxin module